MDSAKWNDPVVKGKAGVIVDTGSRASQIQSAMEEADESNKDIIDIVGSLEGPNGKRTFPTSGYSGMITIPKSSVKTEKELKEVLSFLDKMNDKEAQILTNNGVKGRNYELKDGVFTSLEKITNLSCMSMKAWHSSACRFRKASITSKTRKPSSSSIARTS